MQSDYKHIYKLTSESTGESEQLYKDIGNFVFAQLYKEFRRPSKLIIKLKGVGSWYLRKKRMEIVLKEYPYDPNKEVKDWELFKYENKKEIQEIFKLRLQDYEEYIKERSEIRKIRYGTQTLLEPTNRKDQDT